jgi:hypothetical protein
MVQDSSDDPEAILYTITNGKPKLHNERLH